jgi:hypothetical protein
LFVIALVSVVASWSQLAKVVTSFTAAHITLALGALELVRIAALVEPLIAASILYVGMENVFRERLARAWASFGFGLVRSRLQQRAAI